MRLTFLGTGTSHGVPVIGCDCNICQSSNPKDKRTRSSLWIQTPTASILIDTANEFRIQALQAGIDHVDAVLYTHCHADHVFGFDDLRIFSQRSGKSIPVFGNKATIEEMYEVFSYVFRQTQRGGGKPQVEPTIVDTPFRTAGELITPIPVNHGILPILGYRVRNVAYITDCSAISPESLALLEGVELLILGVIRYEPHPTHMHVEAALQLIEKINPKRAYFTHISHRLGHEAVNAALPAPAELAHDGLVLEC